MHNASTDDPPKFRAALIRQEPYSMHCLSFVCGSHCRVDPEGANPAMAPIQFCHILWPPSREEKNFCLNFHNFCDYFVKKLVSEIRKCHQLDHYMLVQTCSHARHVV